MHTFTDREQAFLRATCAALRRFRAPRQDELQLRRIQSAIREADRRHTPEEIAAAERALGVA